MNKTISKLDLVQTILSRMVEEGVTSTGESEAAEQVAMIVENAYYDILTMKDWEYLTKAGTLISNPDDSTTLKLPYDLVSLHWFKYKDNVLTEIKDWDSYISKKVNAPQDPRYYIVLGDVIYFDAVPEEGLIPSNGSIFYTREPNPIPTDDSILDAPRRFIHVIRDMSLMLAYSSVQDKESTVKLYASLVKKGLTFLQRWQYNGPTEKSAGYGVNYGRK